MTRPLAIELFAGLHGWGAGFSAAGFRVVGFDIANMGKAFGAPTPDGCQLVIQDVLTLHGSQFRDAAVIVASPPCQNYSYLAMPWSRSKDPNNSKQAKALRRKWETEGPDNRLFDACFRIQREAIAATLHCAKCGDTGVQNYAHGVCCQKCQHYTKATRYIPLIVENVRGAQPWVGRSVWNYGSFHLWGDVPALMPITLRRGQKVPGFRFDGSGGSFQTASVEGMKANPNGTNHPQGSWFRIADSAQGDRGQNGHGGMWFGPVAQRGDPRAAELNSDGTRTMPDGTKVPGLANGRFPPGGLAQGAIDNGTKIGGDWFSDPKSTCRKHGSRSNARKMASAMIAKIPRELAEWIARVYYPRPA